MIILILNLLIPIVSAFALDQNLNMKQTLDKPETEKTNGIIELYNEKKYSKIVEDYGKKLEFLPVGDILILGKSYQELKNNTAALKIFQMALSKEPKNVETKTLIGEEYFRSGKEREAMLQFREALDLNAKYEPAYYGIEKIYIRKKNKYELRILFQDMIEKIGEKVEYVMRLCELSTNSGLYDMAQKYCRRGIVLDKSIAENYVFLSITLKEIGQIDESVSLMKRAADNFTTSEIAQITYAKYLENKKDFFNSIKYYKRATQINSTSNDAWIGLANSNFESKNYDESIINFQTACSISRDSMVQVRKSLASIRTLKEDKWLAKFESLVDRCYFSLQR